MANPPLPVVVTRNDLPHVCTVLVFGLSLASILAIQIDKSIAHDEQDRQLFYYPKVGLFLFTYMFLLALTRLYNLGTYVLYELLWGCNMGIYLVIIAVFLNKPFLVGVAMAIVSGDQICWYVDLLAYLLTGRFYIGVVKYLFSRKNRSVSIIFFAMHHIWFLPLCLWLLTGHGGMHSYSFFGASMITTLLAIYTRIFVPYEVKVPGKPDIVYMNVNGSYAFWKDIPIPFLHILNHRSPFLYLPFLATFGNLFVNGIPHLVLLLISHWLNKA